MSLPASGTAAKAPCKYELLLHHAIDRRYADLHSLSESELRDKGVEELVNEEKSRRLGDILPPDQRQFLPLERRKPSLLRGDAAGGGHRMSLDLGSATRGHAVTIAAMPSRRSFDSGVLNRRSSVVVYSSGLGGLDEGSLVAALSSQNGGCEVPKVPTPVLPSLVIQEASGASPSVSPKSPRVNTVPSSKGLIIAEQSPEARSSSFSSSRHSNAAALSGKATSLCSSPIKSNVEPAAFPDEGSSKPLVVEGRSNSAVFSPQSAAKAAGRLFAFAAVKFPQEKPFGGVGNAAQCAAARALEEKLRRKSRDNREPFSQTGVMARLSRWGDGKRLEDDS